MAMNVCQVCIEDIVQEENPRNIFHGDYNGRKINEVLGEVTNDFIEKSDPGSHLICDSCFIKLGVSYDFLKTYTKSKVVFCLLSKSKSIGKVLQSKRLMENPKQSKELIDPEMDIIGSEIGKLD